MITETTQPEIWGWNQHFFSSSLPLIQGEAASASWIPGRITAREHYFYEVYCPDFSGRLANFQGQEKLVGYHRRIQVSGRFEHLAQEPADYPAVGDWVFLESKSNTLRIQEVLPRSTRLSRNSAGEETLEQVLASNMTWILLVFGLDGARNFVVRLLERSLTVAWNSGAQPVVVLNKRDCATPELLEQALAEASYAAAGAPVYAVSARTGEGLEELCTLFQRGDTIAMLGKSGVGKSALLNALHRRYGSVNTTDKLKELEADPTDSPGTEVPQEIAKEGRQRRGDLQGRHTTTNSRIYFLGPGILMIDSPGLRELQLWGDREDVNRSFPDIEEFAVQCRFKDCSHKGEPGCAVQEALVQGALDPSRYASYLDLLREQAYLKRRTDIRAELEEKNKWKAIGKSIKQLKKGRELY